MDYTSDYYFMESGKNVREVGFNSSGEACAESMFDQMYPDFLVGHST